MDEYEQLLYNMEDAQAPQRMAHMFPMDIEIWERFLAAHRGDFLGFIYDVKIGSGTKPLDDLAEPYRGMQRVLSRYRVDVIGVKHNELTLFEVKPSAGTGALGQVVSYARLFRRDYKPQLKVIPALLTDFERPDMRHLAEKMGVQYHIA
jgi:hypothetical protein